MKLYDYSAQFYPRSARDRCGPLLGRLVSADMVVLEPGNPQALNQRGSRACAICRHGVECSAGWATNYHFRSWADGDIDD